MAMESFAPPHFAAQATSLKSFEAPQALPSMIDMYNQSKYTDVVVSCPDGRAVNAHTVILCSQSGFFDRECSKFSSGTLRKVYLQNIEWRTLRRVIEFLYSGTYSCEYDPDRMPTPVDSPISFPTSAPQSPYPGIETIFGPLSFTPASVLPLADVSKERPNLAFNQAVCPNASNASCFTHGKTVSRQSIFSVTEVSPREVGDQPMDEVTSVETKITPPPSKLLELNFHTRRGIESFIHFAYILT